MFENFRFKKNHVRKICCEKTIMFEKIQYLPHFFKIVSKTPSTYYVSFPYENSHPVTTNTSTHTTDSHLIDINSYGCLNKLVIDLTTQSQCYHDQKYGMDSNHRSESFITTLNEKKSPFYCLLWNIDLKQRSFFKVVPH